MEKEDFEEPFEITKDIAAFLEEYKLWDQLDVVGDVTKFTKEKDEEKPPPKLKVVQKILAANLDEPYATMKSAYAGNLEGSYESFIEVESAEATLDEIQVEYESEIEKLAEHTAKEHGVDLKDIGFAFHVGHDTNYDSTWFKVTLNSEEGKENFMPGSLHWAFSEDSLTDSASDNSWAAWLGIYESPFFDSHWLEAYQYHESANVLEQLWATSEENDDDDTLKALMKKVLGVENEEDKDSPKFTTPHKDELKRRELRRKAKKGDHLKMVKTSLVAALNKLVS